MGAFVNPGNDGFAGILKDRYVDKTGIIAPVNGVVGTPRKLVCVTRPRRFGKTFAAEAVSSYYSCGCDSSELFAGLDISRDPSYGEHLNAYNVARLDMAGFKFDRSADVVEAVSEVLLGELREEFDCVGECAKLDAAILKVVRSTHRKFVFVIDEWDAPIRNATRDEQAGRDYVDFLRVLFKNANFTSEAIAAAYITGILPIKHYGTQSALNDFDEFTMVDCARYAPYVGFVEGEVERLCAEFGMDLDEMRRWYDGYELPGAGRVYAPFSVMKACQRGHVGRYWTSSETFEMLRFYIDLDFDGLQGDIVRVIGGDEVPVDPYMFANDMREVHSKDDALTLLVHLGYLAYDLESSRARLPGSPARARRFRSAGRRHLRFSHQGAFLQNRAC